MSRIYDALKRARQESIFPSFSPQKERRRAPRRKAQITIFVYGHGQSGDEEPFHEEAYSSDICELGGLLVMTATVRPGQALLLKNQATQASQECHVVRVGGNDPRTIQVAVEFSAAAAEFWSSTGGAEGAEPPRRNDGGQEEDGEERDSSSLRSSE